MLLVSLGSYHAIVCINKDQPMVIINFFDNETFYINGQQVFFDSCLKERHQLKLAFQDLDILLILNFDKTCIYLFSYLVYLYLIS